MEVTKHKGWCFQMAHSVVLCVLCVLVGLPVNAAKVKTFSHKYKNERLEVVLEDLCHRHGYELRIADADIDMDKPITTQFRNARTAYVLKKVLDPDTQGKVKRGVLTISCKPIKPVVYTIPGTQLLEQRDEDTAMACVYTDTVVSIQYRYITRTNTVAKGPEKCSDRRHNIQLSLGGGYGSLGYSLGDAGKVYGNLAADVQLRYLYHIDTHWAIGIGVGWSRYQSKSVLNTTILDYQVGEAMPHTDSDGERYDHAIRYHDWTEQQWVSLVDIPIMAQYAYPLRVQTPSGPLYLYADLGIKPGFEVTAFHQLVSGTMDHIGYYQPWNLTLEHIDGHDFTSLDAAQVGTDPQALELKQPTVGLMADVGVAVPVSPKVDILVGVYVDYTTNSIAPSNSFVASIHPWQVGVNVGIRFHTGSMQRDTIWELVTKRERVSDTVTTLTHRVERTIKPKPEVAAQIERVMEKSVIWFEANSAEPMLRPADILVRMATILHAHSRQRILITGHASRDGDKAANMVLSQARATAIAERLIALGVSPEQIEVKALGIEVDYVQGAHEIALDRRVEISPIVE